jgi:hypothetical protein
VYNVDGERYIGPQLSPVTGISVRLSPIFQPQVFGKLSPKAVHPCTRVVIPKSVFLRLSSFVMTFWFNSTLICAAQRPDITSDQDETFGLTKRGSGIVPEMFKSE